MTDNKIKSATNQRTFTMVYDDFLESEILDHYEKMVFIAIKRFTNSLSNQAFPSLNRLHKMTGISRSKIQEVISSLQKKGVLRVEHRISQESGNQSNLYTLYDLPEIWNSQNFEELSKEIDRYEENHMIETLRAKGYVVIKEKEPLPETDQSTDKDSKQLHKFDIVNNNSDFSGCQGEKYTLNQIRLLYDYDIIKERLSYSSREVDAVMDILYDVLNTSKKTIKISGEDRPAIAVIGRMMKLSYADIIYAIEQFGKITDRIKNPEAYMITCLYKAAGQATLDIVNQVQHNMG